MGPFCLHKQISLWFKYHYDNQITHLQIPTKARVVRIESDGIGDCIFKMDELSRTLMLGMVSKFLTQRVEVTPLSDPIAFYTPHSRE